MINISKQISYWRKGAEEDWLLGIRITGEGHIRHGLFLIHLALEKCIKAHVCQKTGDIAPRIHNLVRLLQLAGLQHSNEDDCFLADMNKYNIEGRYPEMHEDLPGPGELSEILSKSEQIYLWLRSQL